MMREDLDEFELFSRSRSPRRTSRKNSYSKMQHASIRKLSQNEVPSERKQSNNEAELGQNYKDLPVVSCKKVEFIKEGN